MLTLSTLSSSKIKINARLLILR